jgi:hypothetical protein
MPTISEIAVVWSDNLLNAEGFKEFVENFEWNIVVRETGEQLCFTNQQIMDRTPVKLSQPIINPTSGENPFEYDKSKAQFGSASSVKKFYVNILLHKFNKQDGERLIISLYVGTPFICVHARDVTPE